MFDLSTPVQFVKGIGPERARALGGEGLATVEDLLFRLQRPLQPIEQAQALKRVLQGESVESITVHLQSQAAAHEKKRAINLQALMAARAVLAGGDCCNAVSGVTTCATIASALDSPSQWRELARKARLPKKEVIAGLGQAP